MRCADTGRIVGTGARSPSNAASARGRTSPAVARAGCEGPMQARLSIMRAARQLGEEAGIHLHIRHFDIINEARRCTARA